MSVGESMRARWASCAAGESVARVEGELFVVARGRGAAAFVDALTGGLDPASRSLLASPPADPLAALLMEADPDALSLGALRLTPPWAALVLVGEASLAHGAGQRTRRLEGTALRSGELAVRYLRVGPGERLVLGTGATELVEPSEEACGPLAGADGAALAIAVRER